MKSVMNRVMWSMIVGVGLLAGCADDQPRAVITPQPQPASQPAAAREAALVPTRSPNVESTVQISESAHTLTGTNVTMADLVSVAYRTPPSARFTVPLMSAIRVRSAELLPAGRYDCRVFVPNGHASHLRAELRAYLEEMLGIKVRREVREVDALVLTAPAGYVKRTASAEGEPVTNRTVLSASDLMLLSEHLEDVLQEPVVDETGLHDPYTLRLPQTKQDGQLQPLDYEMVRQALYTQLGLDLVRSRRPVEFIVVEKVAPKK